MSCIPFYILGISVPLTHFLRLILIGRKFDHCLALTVAKSVSALCEFCSNRRICQSCYMDFSKLLHGFVKIDTRICLNLYTVFAKLLNGFVKVLCIPRPLPKNKARDKFDQDFKAC